MQQLDIFLDTRAIQLANEVVMALLAGDAEGAARAAAPVLGHRSKDFLQPFWRDLADRPGAAAYDARQPQLHAAALLVRAGEYQEADLVASRIPGGGQMPEVLRWCCLARHRLDGLDTAMALLLRFAWLAPERFADLVEEIGDPLLTRAWRGFLAALGELDAAWFPAWFLHDHPQAPRLADDLPPAVPAVAAYAVLARLLELEKRGHSPEL